MGDISVGDRFGRWVVSGETEPIVSGGKKFPAWACRCDCGTSRNVTASSLKGGRSSSCGCLARERSSEVNTKHGENGRSPEYYTWQAMRDRCNNPNNPRFSHYGGRGISVCAQWDDYRVFLSDMGRRPTKVHSLDRINNDGNYEPSNCRWATSHQQMTNRTVTRMVCVNGVDVPLATLAKQHGIPANTLRFRILNGWDLDRALSHPIRPKRPNGTR